MVLSDPPLDADIASGGLEIERLVNWWVNWCSGNYLKTHHFDGSPWRH